MEDNAEILTNLYHALIDSGGPQITLVLGAGCSIESPTNLDSGPQVAKDAYDRLVDDEILPPDTLNNGDQWDLTKVASAVVEHSEDNSQRELTRRLPVDDYIHAKPNEGHLIAAALMRETAVAYVLTLNFDKAMNHALSRVSAGSEVATVWGRERNTQTQPPCLIYLHGTADSNQEDLVITPEALEELGEEEENQWEQLATFQALMPPFQVFAGLGSPAPVLDSKIDELQELDHDGAILQVDNAPYQSQAESNDSFTSKVGIPESNYREMTWCEFMQDLGERVAREQIRETARECENQNRDEEAEEGLRERIQNILNRRGGIDLLELGNIRANWLCEHNLEYLPHGNGNVPDSVAALLVIIDLIERNRNCIAVINSEGVVDFYSSSYQGRRHLASIQLVHGRGNDWWSDVDARVLHQRQQKRPLQVTGVVGVGLEGEPDEISLPEDITDLRDKDDGFDLSSPPRLEFAEGIDLHRNSDEVDRLFDI